MKYQVLKTVSAIALSLTLSQITNAKKDENIEVTPIQDVTHQELAAIYVLSEICPNQVSDQKQFEAGYKKLVTEYLPKEKDPVAALNLLSKQSSFKSILDEAKSDAKKAGDAKNKAICEDVATYNN